MDVESRLATNSGFQNWTQTAIALSYLRDGIAGIVVSAIQADYQAIVKTILLRCKLKEYSCSSCTTRDLIPCHDKKTCTQRSCNCSKGTKKCPQSNACGMFYDYIVKAHCGNAPFWNNCDFQKISQNFWEYAKCFISGFGKETITCSDDTDPADMISICLNNRNLRSKFSSETVLKKARSTRNIVMHSSTMEISNEEMKEYIDSLTSVLKEKLCSNDPRAQEALNKLEKLMDGHIIITTKASVCAHRASIKAVYAEIHLLMERAEQLSSETEVFKMEECTDENSEMDIAQTPTVDDVYQRILKLNEAQENHNEIINKYTSQNAEIKDIIDGLSRDMQLLKNTIYAVDRATAEIQADVKLARHDLKEIKSILTSAMQMWSSCVVPVPVNRLHLFTSNIGKQKENKFFMALLDESTVHNGDTWSQVREEFRRYQEEITSDDGIHTRDVTETRFECFALYIQCWTPAGIIKLCEDCVNGLFTKMLKPVEHELRKINGYENVHLEMVMLTEDTKKCLELLVRRLKRQSEAVSDAATMPPLVLGPRTVDLMELIQSCPDTIQSEVQEQQMENSETRETTISTNDGETDERMGDNIDPSNIQEPEDNRTKQTHTEDIEYHNTQRTGPMPIQRAASFPIEEFRSRKDGQTRNNKEANDRKSPEAISNWEQSGRVRIYAGMTSGVQYDQPITSESEEHRGTNTQTKD